MKKPVIISDSGKFGKNGASFTLTCHVEVTTDVAYGVSFYLPNGKLAETNSYLQISQVEHEHGNKRKSHMNLTINNALMERDQGDYTCTVRDLHNNSNSVIHSITFVDSPVVQLNSTNPTIKTAKGKKTATFHFTYFVYPKGTFEWYNPRDELIFKDGDIFAREKYSVSVHDDELSLSIKFPEIEDFGQYTLVAKTDGQTFEKKVRLEVSGK